MDAQTGNSDRTNKDGSDPAALAELRKLDIPGGEIIVWELHIFDMAEQPLVNLETVADAVLMETEECRASLDLLVAAGFVENIEGEYGNSGKGMGAAIARGPVRLC